MLTRPHPVLASRLPRPESCPNSRSAGPYTHDFLPSWHQIFHVLNRVMRRPGVRVPFIMANIMQACSDFHRARVFSTNAFPDENACWQAANSHARSETSADASSPRPSYYRRVPSRVLTSVLSRPEYRPDVSTDTSRVASCAGREFACPICCQHRRVLIPSCRFH